MNTLDQTIRSLHADYERLTGVKLKYTMSHFFRWEVWIGHDWTAADLALVIGYIRKRIKAGQRQKESLKLSLLLDPDRFAEDLSIARSESRAPKMTPKAEILMATGRDPHTVNNARSAGDIMAERSKLAEMLGEWKKENL